MSEKVAAKQTNSWLVLKKHKLFEEGSERRYCCRYTRPCRLATFFIITCSIFLIYWIILTPLLLNTFFAHHANKTDKWSIGWFVLYWFVAFLIWLLIMLCLILIWRCTSVKREDSVKLQSYGTNGPLKSGSLIKLDYLQNAKWKDTKQVEPSNDSTSDKRKVIPDKPSTEISDEPRRNKVKKHVDLPPLVIHRRNSGNDIERFGTINVEKDDKRDEKEDTSKSEDDNQKTRRESMKEYLKLVTVTPQDEVDIKSPKGPLSPRELFFIDLIREAEKAERDRAKNRKGRTEGKYFFPGDFSPTKRDISKSTKEEGKPSGSSTSEEQEAVYFIADVESPKREKTEVFLEIDPDPEIFREFSVNKNDEKPVLILKDNSRKRN